MFEMKDKKQKDFINTKNWILSRFMLDFFIFNHVLYVSVPVTLQDESWLKIIDYYINEQKHVNIPFIFDWILTIVFRYLAGIMVNDTPLYKQKLYYYMMVPLVTILGLFEGSVLYEEFLVYFKIHSKWEISTVFFLSEILFYLISADSDDEEDDELFLSSLSESELDYDEENHSFNYQPLHQDYFHGKYIILQ